ncbi:hypothetical protein AHiyo4_43050 [Arthrobacter sp. Hiyo4]|nr:hypothetical protein AHiyo4_43050 [Arthrobacter sp. Hiyo4]
MQPGVGGLKFQDFCDAGQVESLLQQFPDVQE